MRNYWLDLGESIYENEVILVKNGPETKMWYSKMPMQLHIIYPSKKPQRPEDFAPKVGLAHSLRLSRHGIEGVLKAPKKYFRLEHYVLHDKINQPSDPFWVVFYNKLSK